LTFLYGEYGQKKMQPLREEDPVDLWIADPKQLQVRLNRAFATMSMPSYTLALRRLLRRLLKYPEWKLSGIMHVCIPLAKDTGWTLSGLLVEMPRGKLHEVLDLILLHEGDVTRL
jgi:hypothetical protein